MMSRLIGRNEKECFLEVNAFREKHYVEGIVFQKHK